jgi:hypothetical protein
MRGKDWGKAAVIHADLYVRWAVIVGRASALALEQAGPASTLSRLHRCGID